MFNYFFLYYFTLKQGRISLSTNIMIPAKFGRKWSSCTLNISMISYLKQKCQNMHGRQTLIKEMKNKSQNDVPRFPHYVLLNSKYCFHEWGKPRRKKMVAINEFTYQRICTLCQQTRNLMPTKIHETTYGMKTIYSHNFFSNMSYTGVYSWRQEVV